MLTKMHIPPKKIAEFSNYNAIFIRDDSIYINRLTNSPITSFAPATISPFAIHCAYLNHDLVFAQATSELKLNNQLELTNTKAWLKSATPAIAKRVMQATQLLS
jgi:hypothetical protein